MHVRNQAFYFKKKIKILFGNAFCSAYRVLPRVLTLRFPGQHLTDDHVTAFKTFLSVYNVCAALQLVAESISLAVYGIIMQSTNIRYKQIGQYLKSNAGQISDLVRLNKDNAEAIIVTDKYLKSLIAILPDTLKRADIQASDVEQIEAIAVKWVDNADLDLTVGIADDEQDTNRVAKLAESFLKNCTVFKNASFLHGSIEIRIREKIYTRWIEVKIKSATGIEVMRLLPVVDANGEPFKYNAVVAFDFEGDLSPINDAIEVLQIDSDSDCSGFLRNLDRNVKVVSGRIGGHWDKSNNPLKKLLRSDNLQFILLHGVDELVDLPDGLRQEMDSWLCDLALEQMPPSAEKKQKAICLSIPANMDGYEGVIKKPCSRYENYF